MSSFSHVFEWLSNTLGVELDEDFLVLVTVAAAVSWALCIILWGFGAPAPEKPDPGILKGYTVQELAQYNGVNGAPVFIACKGIVYDADPDHYGPLAGYNAFVAKDASRHFGKMTVCDSESNRTWEDLSAVESNILDDWEKKFRSKYPVVGWVVADWAPTPPREDPGPVKREELPDWPTPVGPWPPPRAPRGAAGVPAGAGGPLPGGGAEGMTRSGQQPRRRARKGK
eukprot:TRINITY_DN44384_c0_g1_i1.p1 TRINITY_DN44384_c0_g1~~TRINITY_DN44384_c0_g1_i1.p1  ORF type:complete len:227 (+),score=14.43 TRINITY_DN44384_c0_g1_i1:99-779(+)